MAEKSASADAVGADAERDFVITRVFDAPRETVFSAWTDPKHLAQWWGPRIFTTYIYEMNVRPGGAYRIAMRVSDGTEYSIKGLYREIVKPERLVMTMDVSEHPAAWHDMVKPNRRKDESNPAGEMLMTATFDEVGEKTRLTVRVRLISTEIRDAMLKMGMTEGWSESLDRLREVVARI
jgi:uncharacterized protein YndB with AHSA1/START domain